MSTAAEARASIAANVAAVRQLLSAVRQEIVARGDAGITVELSALDSKYIFLLEKMVAVLRVQALQELREGTAELNAHTGTRRVLMAARAHVDTLCETQEIAWGHAHRLAAQVDATGRLSQFRRRFETFAAGNMHMANYLSWHAAEGLWEGVPDGNE